MNVLHIINASKMGELKSLGSYAQVKYALESELGNKLGCSGWLSLFNKLTFLKSVVPSSKDDLLIACEAASLRISISKVSSILGLKVKAETRSELAGVVRRFIAMFPPTTFDPYQHYEKTKFAKFKGSSKLEGIDIRHLDDKVTLDSLLNKHRR